VPQRSGDQNSRRRMSRFFIASNVDSAKNYFLRYPIILETPNFVYCSQMYFPLIKNSKFEDAVTLRGGEYSRNSS
jgi:hypothetical protein